VVDAVDFARDDVADVLWGIDRIILGADGRPRTMAITPPAPPSVATPTYRLGPDVDGAFHPYRWRAAGDRPGFALVRIPGGAAAAPRADLPATLNGHALATGAQRLTRRPNLFRTADGGYHVIYLRSCTSVPGPGSSMPMSSSSPLGFDSVQEPS